MNEELNIRLKYLLRCAVYDDLCEECVDKIVKAISELIKQKEDEET